MLNPNIRNRTANVRVNSLNRIAATKQKSGDVPNRLPVSAIIVACSVAWLLCVVIATNFLLQTPYLGMDVVSIAGEAGVTVESVAKDGPANKAGVEPGVKLTSVGVFEQDLMHQLTIGAGVHDRSEVNNYADWNLVRSDRIIIWEAMRSSTVTFVGSDGAIYSIKTDSRRELFQFPFGFWLSASESILVLMLTLGITLFAPASPAMKYLLISGISLSTNMLAHAFRACEEFVLAPAMSGMIYVMGNLSAPVFAFGLLALLWHMPKPPSRFPLGAVGLSFALLSFIIQHFQLLSYPVHPFQFPYLAAIVSALVLTVVKWFRSGDKPVERAVLLWVLLSIVVGILPWIVLFSLPILVGTGSLVKPAVAGQSLVIVFLGFALGTVKFRLFGIRAIWLQTLIWLTVGGGIVAVDLFILFTLHWNQEQALPAAILLASWSYFPLKSLIHNRFINRNAVSMEDTAKRLFLHLASVPDPTEFNGRFMGFLRQYFQAQNVEIDVNAAGRKATILENGLVLRVPSMSKNSAYLFSGSFKGKRLFSDANRKTADILYELANGIYQQKLQEYENAETARALILRDLHDDVGAKLLDLIYATPEDSSERALARQALKALKDSLLTIEDIDGLDLENRWVEFWSEQETRLQNVGFGVDFTTNFIGSRIISARDFVNVKRIVEEHVSNILKYGCKNQPIKGSVELLQNGEMKLKIGNSVDSAAEHTTSTGRGFLNMQARAKETSAQLSVGAKSQDEDWFELSLSLPLLQ